jgi:hypothetical protein
MKARMAVHPEDKSSSYVEVWSSDVFGICFSPRASEGSPLADPAESHGTFLVRRSVTINGMSRVFVRRDYCP